MWLLVLGDGFGVRHVGFVVVMGWAIAIGRCVRESEGRSGPSPANWSASASRGSWVGRGRRALERIRAHLVESKCQSGWIAFMFRVTRRAATGDEECNAGFHGLEVRVGRVVSVQVVHILCWKKICVCGLFGDLRQYAQLTARTESGRMTGVEWKRWE